jgi:cobalt-zinc-cadmium efflux system membrane fusion protein
MTNAPPEAATPSPAPSLLARAWSAGQLLLALAITTAFLAYLLVVPGHGPRDRPAERRRPPSAVEVVGPGLFRVAADSPARARMALDQARRERVRDAVMTVTGRVAASLRPGGGKGKEFWQFDAPDVLTAHTDWLKARADIVFTEKQLEQVKELAQAKLDAQEKVVARTTKLVAAGTEAGKELATEKANLLQARIQGRKDTHEAETAVRVARRAEAASARQLQQAGLDPDLLRNATSDMDIVLADVPEGMLKRVKVGQGCEARFFGFADQVFPGKVSSIAPVLSRERRSLRVLFVVDDPNDQLRPGMFAEIGLGTDPRDAVLVPADAVLHVGRADYVLVADGEGWRVTEVQVGEARNGDVEVLYGLSGGEKVIAKGAVLFKPTVVRSLEADAGRKGAGR